MNNFCHCGTMAEATDAAEKLFVEMASVDCPVWALQVATALRSICIDVIEADEVTPLTRRELAVVANEMVVEARLTRKATPEIKALFRERRKHLHGES